MSEPTHTATVDGQEMILHLDTPNGSFHLAGGMIHPCAACGRVAYSAHRLDDQSWSLLCGCCGASYPIRPYE